MVRTCLKQLLSALLCLKVVLGIVLVLHKLKMVNQNPPDQTNVKVIEINKYDSKTIID